MEWTPRYRAITAPRDESRPSTVASTQQAAGRSTGVDFEGTYYCCEFVRILLNKGANMHITDSDSYTALHFSPLRSDTSRGHGRYRAPLVHRMAGADLEATANRGVTPLHRGGAEWALASDER